MNQKSDFIQVGITTDNKPVLSGIYKFYETHGIPLDVIFICFMENNWVPSWIDLYKDCKLAGIKHERIIAKLSEAIQDSFGEGWAQQVISKLNLLFTNKE